MDKDAPEPGPPQLHAEADASRWDERIARARELAAEDSPAAGILTFYARLAEYQRSLGLFSSRRSAGLQTCTHAGPGRTEVLRCTHTQDAPAHETGSPLTPDFVQTVDLDAASAAVPDFLAWLQRTAPEPLARAAAATLRPKREQWRQLMHRCLTQSDDDLAEDAMTFVMEAVVQPFTEAAAIAWRADGPKSSAPGVRASICPICSGRPVVAILREEGHGARRTLLCALCLNEWEFPRVVCPACDEQRFDVLPVYTADVFSHVRIDACDNCKRYLKTVDLTKNGLAVPLVDDLASVALDLWAHQQGYRRLRTNLLRTAEVQSEK